MTRWIRGWGLAGIVALTAALAACIVFFADHLVKRAVESVGSSANGAKVELQDASLSFDPLGFALTDLQVTDAHEPMRNVVQIQRIRFALDGYALLRRKVVITDLSAEGVRTNTPRTYSGALPQLPAPSPETKQPGMLENFSFPQVDLPDAKQFMADNEFTSDKLAGQLRNELDQGKEQWNQRLAGLPGSEALKNYEERIQQSKPNLKGNVLQDAQEIAVSIERLQILRDDIGNDLKNVKALQQTWATDWARWSKLSKDLIAAPGADIDRLKEKYSLDAKGLANATRALFGGQIARWVETSLYWYGKAKPLLARDKAEQEQTRQRGKGIDVHFPERDQLPDFLIRSAKLGLEVPAGILRGEIRNITNDQVTLGHPLTFNFFAEKMPGLQDLELEGVFNHVAPGAALDSARFKAHGVAIQRFDVLRQPRFPLVLSDAAVDLDATAQLKGGVLRSDLSADFKTVKLSADLKGPAGELEKTLMAALTDVHHFMLKGRLQGSLPNYDFELHSDLDELLRDAMNRQFRARIDRFTGEIKARLDARVREIRRELDAKLGDLNNIGGVIDQRRTQVDEVQQEIEQELHAALDKQKSAAVGNTGQVDEQKQSAKEKARQEAGKLKDRLKDQLKL